MFVTPNQVIPATTTGSTDGEESLLSGTCPIVKREHFLDVILGQFCGSLDRRTQIENEGGNSKGKVSKLIYQKTGPATSYWAGFVQ